METINVRDLPEPVARALEAVVETLRTQLATEQKRKHERIELQRRPGRVIGNLTRDEIYNHVR